MITIRLTAAQRSALECAGLELAEDGPEVVLRAAWQGDRLVFDVRDREALFDALNDRSNAEDAQAEEQRDRYARQAARSLAAVASRVLRAGRTR